jgi:hypothetical protein
MVERQGLSRCSKLAVDALSRRGGAARTRVCLEEDDTMELSMEERRHAHRQLLQHDGDVRLTVARIAAAWAVLSARLDGARGRGQGELGLWHRPAEQRQGEAEWRRAMTGKGNGCGHSRRWRPGGEEKEMRQGSIDVCGPDLAEGKKGWDPAQIQILYLWEVKAEAYSDL